MISYKLLLSICIFCMIASCRPEPDDSPPLGMSTILQRFNGKFKGSMNGPTFGDHQDYIVRIEVFNDTLAYLTSPHLDSVPIVFWIDTVNQVIVGDHTKNWIYHFYFSRFNRLDFSSEEFFGFSYVGIRIF